MSEQTISEGMDWNWERCENPRCQETYPAGEQQSHICADRSERYRPHLELRKVYEGPLYD